MKLAFMIAQKHLGNNHNVANIDISGIIITTWIQDTDETSTKIASQT
jgi:hypothetical protein